MCTIVLNQQAGSCIKGKSESWRRVRNTMNNGYNTLLVQGAPSSNTAGRLLNLEDLLVHQSTMVIVYEFNYKSEQNRFKSKSKLSGQQDVNRYEFNMNV